MNISDRRVLHTGHEQFIERLKKRGSSYYIRQGTECVEIVVDEINFFFKKEKRFPLSFLYLFGLVRKEAGEWTMGKTHIELPTEYPSVKYNYDFNQGRSKIVGYDLNHAYWRIAKNLGIIRPSTFEKALKPEAKAIRLAALSTMGRSKVYEFYKGGELLDGKKHITKEDRLLMDAYKLIRLTCFKMMFDASEILGDDFDCWKTDCIYFRDTEENRKSMSDFFVSNGLTYKLLEY
jgi:hypothetical protein